MPPWGSITVLSSVNNLKFHLFNKLSLSTYSAGNVIVNRTMHLALPTGVLYTREGNRCQTTNVLAIATDFQPDNLNPSWTQLSLVQKLTRSKRSLNSLVRVSLGKHMGWRKCSRGWSRWGLYGNIYVCFIGVKCTSDVLSLATKQQQQIPEMCASHTL